MQGDETVQVLRKSVAILHWVSGTISGLAEYETSNWCEKLLSDGATLRNKDSFFHGSAITLKTEAYLSSRSDVNPEQIGIIGICGWGGISLVAAVNDTQIKAAQCQRCTI